MSEVFAQLVEAEFLLRDKVRPVGGVGVLSDEDWRDLAEGVIAFVGSLRALGFAGATQADARPAVTSRLEQLNQHHQRLARAGILSAVVSTGDLRDLLAVVEAAQTLAGQSFGNLGHREFYALREALSRFAATEGEEE